MAKKPQTEEKAKGLLKNVGNYKGKTLNLSKKQLGASGRAAAATRKIAISRTTYDPATKKVLGPMGKPITGRVDLGGGNIAVYKNGVRVRAGGGGNGQKKQTGPRNTSTSTSTSDSTKGARDYSKGASQYRPMTSRTTKKTASGAALSPRQISAARRGEAAATRSGTNRTMNPGASKMTASSIRSVGMAPSKPSMRGNEIDRRAVGGGDFVRQPDREAGGRGNKKPIMYANGTASVFDPRLGKRVTVGKSDPRHPKYKK